MSYAPRTLRCTRTSEFLKLQGSSGFQEYLVTDNRIPYPTIHAPKEEVALKFYDPLLVWLILVSDLKIGIGLNTGYELVTRQTDDADRRTRPTEGIL